MATITTSWARYDTQRLSWWDSYSGRTWEADVGVEAYYSKVDNYTITVHTREVVSLIPPSGYNRWYGTNKYYNVNNNGHTQDGADLVQGEVHVFSAWDFNVSAGGSFYISAYYEVMGSGVTAGATLNAPTFVVPPNTPSISGSNSDPYKNIITFGTSSFGVPSSGTVYLYGGTSSSPTTQLTSKTTLGNSNFTHNGLLPNTKYYYRARAKNSSNEWSGYSSTISVTTRRAVYVSKDNTAKLARKLEIPFNGLAKNVSKLYDSQEGKARRIY